MDSTYKTHHRRRRIDARVGRTGHKPLAVREGHHNIGWRCGYGTRMCLGCLSARAPRAMCKRLRTSELLTCLVRYMEVVLEGMVLRNRALRHKRHAVRPVRPMLKQPMPMLCHVPMPISVGSAERKTSQRKGTHDARCGKHSLVLKLVHDVNAEAVALHRSELDGLGCFGEKHSGSLYAPCVPG